MGIIHSFILYVNSDRKKSFHGMGRCSKELHSKVLMGWEYLAVVPAAERRITLSDYVILNTSHPTPSFLEGEVTLFQYYAITFYSAPFPGWRLY
jgi:hypothetical protein